MDDAWDTIWERHLRDETVTARLRERAPYGWTVEVLGLPGVLHTAAMDQGARSRLASGATVEAHVLKLDRDRGILDVYIRPDG